MTSVRDLLRDADPLRQEPGLRDTGRDRLRRSVIAAASAATTPQPVWFRRPVVLSATIAVFVLGIAAVGFQIWSEGAATVHAAIRFEVRLAEAQFTPGRPPATLKGSDRVFYLHDEVVLSNSDIARTSLIEGDRPSRFGVVVVFNAAGAERMRQATARHLGKPLAILIDGELVATPTLTTPISSSAVITGEYTRAEAGRLEDGVRLR